MDNTKNRSLIYIAILVVVCVYQASGSVRCLQCKAGHPVHTCPTIECQSNELCHAGQVIHHLRPAHVADCMQASACQHLTSLLMQYMESESSASSVIGKKNIRSLHMCDICCGDDFCNKENCVDIKHKMYEMYTAGTLNMTSLSLKNPAGH